MSTLLIILNVCHSPDTFTGTCFVVLMIDNIIFSVSFGAENKIIKSYIII